MKDSSLSTRLTKIKPPSLKQLFLLNTLLASTRAANGYSYGEWYGKPTTQNSCRSNQDCPYEGKCIEKTIKKRNGQKETLKRCNCAHFKCEEYPTAYLCIDRTSIGLKEDPQNPIMSVDSYCQIARMQCEWQRPITVSIIEEACERLIYSSEELTHYFKTKGKVGSQEGGKVRGLTVCGSEFCNNKGICVQDLLSESKTCRCKDGYSGGQCLDLMGSRSDACRSDRSSEKSFLILIVTTGLGLWFTIVIGLGLIYKAKRKPDEGIRLSRASRAASHAKLNGDFGEKRDSQSKDLGPPMTPIVIDGVLSSQGTPKLAYGHFTTRSSIVLGVADSGSAKYCSIASPTKTKFRSSVTAPPGGTASPRPIVKKSSSPSILKRNHLSGSITQTHVCNPLARTGGVRTSISASPSKQALLSPIWHSGRLHAKRLSSDIPRSPTDDNLFQDSGIDQARKSESGLDISGISGKPAHFIFPESQKKIQKQRAGSLSCSVPNLEMKSSKSESILVKVTEEDSPS